MASPQKIGVLTFHRCINYGSYWQARCLVEGLRGRGKDAVLLDHHSGRVDRAEWRCALQPLAPAPTPKADRPDYVRKTRKFFEAFQGLPRSERFALHDPAAMEPYDVVVVGSDEVWNLRHPWYAGVSLFFGDGVRAKRLVSYAASFGSHDVGEGLDHAWAAKLQGFAAISVRDENSQQMIERSLGLEAPLVLDPCLQFDIPDQGAETGQEDYVAVYGHSFSDEFKRALRQWARSRRLRLVSIGYGENWTDEQRIAAGPGEFARLMAGARAVATNFFHGCVFALANSKPFVCALSDYRLNKVRALCSAVGAEDRLVTADTAASRYQRLLEEPLAPRIAEQLSVLRQRSNAYLDHALA
jgi:hypothetical protein